MVSSNRRALACILVLIALASFALAQKEQAGSISGKVTIKEKAAAGILVAAVQTGYSRSSRNQTYRGTTDEEGNYRINNIPAGNYTIYPLAPAFVVGKGRTRQTLAVGAGENISDVDFALIRGGVITGRVTDADGQPLIEEIVNVIPEDPDAFRADFERTQTDDRGVYRVFGLSPGKYRISIGRSGLTLPGFAQRSYRETFYPSVTDPKKATVLEVTEAGEIQNIDIVARSPVSSFTVSGRVIDGQTRKPIADIQFEISQRNENSSVSTTGVLRSNRDGEFRLENVIPGRYTLRAIPPPGTTWRTDPFTFDVVDRDLSGFEIKTMRAGSVAGVVVDISDEKPIAAKRGDVMIFARTEHPSMQYGAGSATPIEPDGSFKIGGLEAGIVRIALSQVNSLKHVEIVSMELNGVPQPDGIQLRDEENLNGLRIFVRQRKLTGAVHGQIKFENGEPGPNTRIMVSLTLQDPTAPNSRERIGFPNPEVDSRGRFTLAELAAGTYDVSVLVYGPGQYYPVKQQVTVTENATTEVTLTLRLRP